MATWTDSVKQMATFYASNVHTYQGTLSQPRKGRRAYSCPLLGGNVYDDCSGFTSACLQLMGVFPRSYVPTSGYFADPNGKVAAYLKKAGFTPFRYSISSLQPFDIIARNGHVEIYAGKVGNSMKAYAWGNIHDYQKGGLPCYMAKEPYTLIWRNNGVNIDTPIQLNMSIQEQMNSEYGSGGTFAQNNFQFGYTSNTYPIHTEYDTFSGNGGKTVFELVDDNALRMAALMIDTSVRDSSSNIHTRIYSTNDSTIVLDELTLPLDSSIYDTWAGKGNTAENTSTYNPAAKQPANISTNKNATS